MKYIIIFLQFDNLKNSAECQIQSNSIKYDYKIDFLLNCQLMFPSDIYQIYTT